MKANELPKKLYVDLFKGEFSVSSSTINNSVDIEYTRTDAFIEKAADYIANKMQCNGYTLQTKAKFIKDFRSYMKGW